MKFESSIVALALASLAAQSTAFQPVGVSNRAVQQVARRVASSEVETVESAEPGSAKLKTLTIDIISKLRFREAVKELELRELNATGTLTDMRTRLRELVTDDETGNSKAGDVRVIEEESLNNVSER